MVTGLINIALGAVGIYLGLSGRVLAFTSSSNALVIVSAAAVGLGAYQIWRDRRR